jgi:hypothetical protein
MIMLTVRVSTVGLLVASILACGFSENYNRAYTRGANIKSMIAIRNVAVALEQYRADHGEYPVAGSMNELRTSLSSYLGEELGIDRWGEPLVVTVTADSYTLSSKGDDGQGGHENGGAVEAAGHSITLRDGRFVQYHSIVEDTARKYEAEIAATRSAPDAASD